VNNVYSIATPRRAVRMGPPPAPVTSPLCVFMIRWNGVIVPDFDGAPIRHGSLWSVCERIARLEKEYCTSAGCFRVDRDWL
jgi:hypothetical protein